MRPINTRIGDTRAKAGGVVKEEESLELGFG